MSQSLSPPSLERDDDRVTVRRAQFEYHYSHQSDLVKALHGLMRGLEMLCYVIAAVAFAYGLYETVRWLFTGDATPLVEAWMTYGFSMSLIVLPMGLDVLLLRAFPTDIGIMDSQLDVDSLKELTTGVGALLFGIAITLCGLPGAVYMTQLGLAFVRSYT